MHTKESVNFCTKRDLRSFNFCIRILAFIEQSLHMRSF